MRPEVEGNINGARSILGYGIANINGNPDNASVVDTNVLVNDPGAIDKLEQNGNNAVVVPWVVLTELDVLKNQQDISKFVADAVRNINRRLREKDPNFYVAQADMSLFPDLDKESADHHIIATALHIAKQYPQLPVKIISNDAGVHAVGLCLGITVEEYKADQVDGISFEQPLPQLSVDDFKMDGVGNLILPPDFDLIPPNGGGLVVDDKSFAVIRKGNLLMPIREDIGAMGIVPYSIDPTKTNWEQYVAMQQLLDNDIKVVTLHGEAGTGKTLLAIAAAVQRMQGKKAVYRKIMIARPFVHLGDKDKMGALPGNIEAKSDPWLAPLYDNLDVLSALSDSNDRIISMLQANKKNGLEILPLSFVRGRSLSGVYLVIDEAQNLTRAEVKTIVTRAGEGTKVVLVGDIRQIDIRWLDSKSSGLTHVTVKMAGLPYVANTYLAMSVRSETARDAARLL